MNNFQQFAQKVHDMRVEQKNYFEQIGRAKKTKSGVDFATAATTLKRSKALEAQVDELTQTLLADPGLSPADRKFDPSAKPSIQ